MRLSSSILCYPREGCDSQLFSEFDTSRECCIESETGRSYDGNGAAEHCHTCEGIIIRICLLLTSLHRLIPGYGMGVTDCETNGKQISYKTLLIGLHEEANGKQASYMTLLIGPTCF